MGQSSECIFTIQVRSAVLILTIFALQTIGDVFAVDSIFEGATFEHASRICALTFEIEISCRNHTTIISFKKIVRYTVLELDHHYLTFHINLRRILQYNHIRRINASKRVKEVNYTYTLLIL